MSVSLPYHHAASIGDLRTIKDAAEKINREHILEMYNAEGFAPLHLAAQHGQFEMARLLVRHKKLNTDVDMPCQDGRTALLIAASRANELSTDAGVRDAEEYLEICRMLLQYTNEPAAASPFDGCNVLHYLVHLDDSGSLMRSLMRSLSTQLDASSLNARALDGTTPLYRALHHGRGYTARLLLRGGAVAHTTSEGTVLDVARNTPVLNRDESLINMLKAALQSSGIVTKSRSSSVTSTESTGSVSSRGLLVGGLESPPYSPPLSPCASPPYSPPLSPSASPPASPRTTGRAEQRSRKTGDKSTTTTTSSSSSSGSSSSVRRSPDGKAHRAKSGTGTGTAGKKSKSPSRKQHQLPPSAIDAADATAADQELSSSGQSPRAGSTSPRADPSEKSGFRLMRLFSRSKRAKRRGSLKVVQDLLDLSNRGYKSVPTQQILRSLNEGLYRSISLSNNHIKHLKPSHMRSLVERTGLATQLQDLDLSHNRFIQIPSEISFLIELRKLNLRQNRLTGVPGTLGLLRELRHLDLCDNDITFLPPELSQLQKLDTLLVEGNPLSDPPPSVASRGTRIILQHLADRQMQQRAAAERRRGSMGFDIEDALDVDTSPTDENALLKILEHGPGRSSFRRYLERQFAHEHLDFWLAIREFGQGPADSDTFLDRAYHICRTYVATDADQCINLPCELRDRLLAVLAHCAATGTPDDPPDKSAGAAADGAAAAGSSSKQRRGRNAKLAEEEEAKDSAADECRNSSASSAGTQQQAAAEAADRHQMAAENGDDNARNSEEESADQPATSPRDEGDAAAVTVSGSAARLTGVLSCDSVVSSGSGRPADTTALQATLSAGAVVPSADKKSSNSSVGEAGKRKQLTSMSSDEDLHSSSDEEQSALKREFVRLLVQAQDVVYYEMRISALPRFLQYHREKKYNLQKASSLSTGAMAGSSSSSSSSSSILL